MDGPTDSTAGDVSVSLAIGVPATVFGCAVLVASLTTNIVVGRRTVASKTLPAAVKWLTLSLVVADLLFLLCIPMDLLTLNNYPWYLGRFGCKTTALVSEASRFAWIASATSLALQRWLACGRDADVDGDSASGGRWLLALSWTAALALAAPYAVFKDVVSLAWLDYCLLAGYERAMLITYGCSWFASSLGPAFLVAGLFFCHAGRRSQRRLRSDAYFRLSGWLVAGYVALTAPQLSAFLWVDVVYASDHSLAVEVLLVTVACLSYLSSLVHPVLRLCRPAPTPSADGDRHAQLPLVARPTPLPTPPPILVPLCETEKL